MLGEPFVKRFALCYRTVVCLSVCPVCDVGVLWPNGWTDQDETCQVGRPRPWPHCVRWGPSSPSPKGAGPPSPNFRPISVVAKRLDESRWHLAWRWVLVQATLYKVGSGDPSPFPQKKSAHVYCGQTAGWIKMVLGMEISLSPGDFVLDGDSGPLPQKRRSPLPNFRPISIVPKRLDASRCHSVWR